MDGSLALLVRRGNRTDARLAGHEARPDSPERARRPLACVTALAAVSAVAVTARQIAGR
ncbi:hypothetical protein AB0B78_05685 [Streptomyces sp. NPDC040724]|uniref:hypothetical protein n=1 Tax=unclassified Streptomyces TaxID=2593676 RepID=UPI0033F1CDBF